MKILDALHKDAIITDLKANDKASIIRELAAPLSILSSIDHEYIVDVLIKREKLGSTGIGGMIGIPHGKLKDLDKDVLLGFGLSKNGVDFESIDGVPVRIFFALLTPENSTSLHLRVLAGISRILRNNTFKQKLLCAVDKDAVIKIIKDVDENF